MLDSDLKELGYLATIAVGNTVRVCYSSELREREAVDAWSANDHVDWVLPRLIMSLRLLRTMDFKLEELSFGVGFQPLPGLGGYVFAITVTSTPDETGGWSVDDLLNPTPKVMWSRVTDELLEIVGSEF